VKRTALIILTAIYLISCVGIGINRFYCCGKLASVTLTYGDNDNTNDQSAKKDNCCKNEKQSFKVKDNHFSVVPFSLDHPAPALNPSFVNFHNEKIVTYLSSKIVYEGNAPPGHSDIPAYILNCTYRI
jgi:hypothetical protein